MTAKPRLVMAVDCRHHRVGSARVYYGRLWLGLEPGEWFPISLAASADRARFYDANRFSAKCDPPIEAAEPEIVVTATQSLLARLLVVPYIDLPGVQRPALLLRGGHHGRNAHRP